MTRKKNRLKSFLCLISCLVMVTVSCNDNPSSQTEVARDTTVNWGTLVIVYKDSVVTAERLQHDLEESRQVIGRYIDSINKVNGTSFTPQFTTDSAKENYKWNYQINVNLGYQIKSDSVATPPCKPGPRPNLAGYETLEFEGPCAILEK